MDCIYRRYSDSWQHQVTLPRVPSRSRSAPSLGFLEKNQSPFSFSRALALQASPRAPLPSRLCWGRPCLQEQLRRLLPRPRPRPPRGFIGGTFVFRSSCSASSLWLALALGARMCLYHQTDQSDMKHIPSTNYLSLHFAHDSRLATSWSLHPALEAFPFLVWSCLPTDKAPLL